MGQAGCLSPNLVAQGFCVLSVDAYGRQRRALIQKFTPASNYADVDSNPLSRDTRVQAPKYGGLAPQVPCPEQVFGTSYQGLWVLGPSGGTVSEACWASSTCLTMAPLKLHAATAWTTGSSADGTARRRGWACQSVCRRAFRCTLFFGFVVAFDIIIQV